MPPSKHSGSSRSAHKDSDQIPVGNMYVLGDYHFALERTSIPGSTNDKIEAICTKLNESKRARKSIQIPSSSQIESWYVEANETEATVYIVEKSNKHEMEYNISGPSFYGHNGNGDFYKTKDYPAYTYWSGNSSVSDGRIELYLLSDNADGVASNKQAVSGFVYDGQTFYVAYGMGNTNGSGVGPYLGMIPWDPIGTAKSVLSGIISDGEPETIMVGRFAIDAKDAGGDGPGSDWEDPEDGGDPTYTLYVEVIGALSGRHNDPIVDPSYSYIPADKATVKDYGCGGDGGHGGGGGAGASTVVVYKFATNQAGSKEITALARRHGYGSGGGKGGKGGDGCILVYY